MFKILIALLAVSMFSVSASAFDVGGQMCHEYDDQGSNDETYGAICLADGGSAADDGVGFACTWGERDVPNYTYEESRVCLVEFGNEGSHVGILCAYYFNYVHGSNNPTYDYQCMAGDPQHGRRGPENPSNEG